jgi:hypothetical protein
MVLIIPIINIFIISKIFISNLYDPLFVPLCTHLFLFPGNESVFCHYVLVCNLHLIFIKVKFSIRYKWSPTVYDDYADFVCFFPIYHNYFEIYPS